MPRASRPKRTPRTYRQKAKQAYLRVAKALKPKARRCDAAWANHFGALRRNLRAIFTMVHEGLLVGLSPKRYRQLLVIQKLNRQQHWMSSTSVTVWPIGW